jgi:hypothetical protein
MSFPWRLVRKRAEYREREEGGKLLPGMLEELRR